jgi:hypothetical protein
VVVWSVASETPVSPERTRFLKTLVDTDRGRLARALLLSVSTGTTTRPAVLSPKTASDLKDLLAFRHFLRHAYAADLERKGMCDGRGARRARWGGYPLQ